MPDSATLAVLKDIVSLIVIAVTLGIAAYGVLRVARPALAWNEGGIVIARHYSVADIYVAVLIGSFLLGGLSGSLADESTGATFQMLLLNIIYMRRSCSACIVSRLCALPGARFSPSSRSTSSSASWRRRWGM
jgi:hypothetical protein